MDIFEHALHIYKSTYEKQRNLPLLGIFFARLFLVKNIDTFF